MLIESPRFLNNASGVWWKKWAGKGVMGQYPPFTQKHCFDIRTAPSRLFDSTLSPYIISTSENTAEIRSAGHTQDWQTELCPVGIFFLITNLVLWLAPKSQHRQKRFQLVSALPHMTSAEAVLWASFDNNLWPGILLKSREVPAGHSDP